jgi:hypothetical protein
MRVAALIGAAVAFAAVAATADAASAQAAQRSRAPAVSLSEATAAQRAQTPRRSLRWREGGRWSLDLNLNQPVGRETELGDVEAGAYYSLSPRLRVGAAAGLARPETDPARAVESDRRAQSRVRLESIFRF